MIKSKSCSLRKFSRQQLIDAREEEFENGGYFVVNGRERIIRLLMVSRRNFPIAIIRKSIKTRDKTFTKYVVFVRSVREDCFASKLFAHFLTDGGVMIGFSVGRKRITVPVVLILKCLSGFSDKAIFSELMSDCSDADFSLFSDKVDFLLRDFSKHGFVDKKSCLRHLGEMVSDLNFYQNERDNEKIGKMVLEDCILVHCFDEKFLGKQNILKIYGF
ncbi:hypothetical protein MHBO_003401 [Bonamia ostreae]|uniref:DNA-directed RNA polymerase n=1 Tax=Bonamia ostreae TaxID=126728 RepID=A0ABV2AQW7_9EUKA